MSPDLLPLRMPLRSARAVALVVLALDLLLAAVAARVLLVERRALYERAERTSVNLARVLRGNLEGTLRQIDIVLVEARAELERTRALGPGAEPELLGALTRLHGQLPFVDAIRTADASGRVEYGIGIRPGMNVDVSDRDYFLRARTEPVEELIISAPLVSRITGKRSIVFSLRANRADGSFGGVVYAVVLLDQFASTLRGVDVGRDGTVALRAGDMALIARQPEPVGAQSPIGDRTITPTLQALVEAGREEATYVSVSPVDHLEKVNAYNRVAGGAFHLLVSSSTDAFLEEWRGSAIRTVTALIAVVLLSVLGARLLLRSWSRESESRFRALVDGAPIAVSVARAGNLLYVNGAFVRSFGIPDAGAAVGHSLLERMGPEDAGRAAERFDRRLRGLPVEPTAEVTLRRADGATFQAAITDATVELADGPAVIAFIQDVTERRRYEAERERLIGDLQKALSDVKTLRGLLPICAHCKKIRDDRGYWNRIETFIRARSEAEFTHGICPDCAQQYYPDELTARADVGGERER